MRYDTNDFLADEFFQERLRYEQPETKAFWNAVLRQYPEKACEIREAYDLLRRLRFTNRLPGADRTRRMWKYIEAHVQEQQAVKRFSPRPKWIIAGACLLLFISLGIREWGRKQYTVVCTANSEKAYVTLPDDVEVTLLANAKLKYVRHFPCIAEDYLEYGCAGHSGKGYCLIQYAPCHWSEKK